MKKNLILNMVNKNDEHNNTSFKFCLFGKKFN